MKPLVIIKIGGSVITKKSFNRPSVKRLVLMRISKEIAAAYRKLKNKRSLVIVHGAGSYGHIIVKKSGINNGLKKEKDLISLAETQRLQNKLNTIITKQLIKRGVPAFPFQASASAVMDGKLKHMDTQALRQLLEIGAVPVAYGVPAADKNKGCSILSGDEIAPFIAKKFLARRIIHATDVDGIFNLDPKMDKNARLIKKISHSNINKILSGIGCSSCTDVTGGMRRKIDEIRKISTCGVESVIINGVRAGNIRNALLEKHVIGTRVIFGKKN